MQLVYRDIASVINHRINLTLPDYINTESVEIIIIPYNPPVMKKPKIDYNKYFGISNIGLALINNYLENIRNDWERTILD